MPIIASVLSIAIQLTKTEFAVGEDPTMTLELLNTGATALVVPEPVKGSGMPCFRVINLSDGSERVVRPPQSFPGVRARIELEKGKVHRSFHKLGAFVPMTTPGRYSLTAIYEWDEESAESAPVVVTVTGLGIRALTINNPSFRYGSVVFVNPVATPPDLMLGDLVLLPDGGVRGLRPVARVPLATTPALSAPANQTPTMGQWVAWMEAETFKAVHVGDTLGPSEAASLKVRGNVEIVSPMFAGPNTSNLTRGPGAAALLRADLLAGTELIIVTLDAEKNRARATEAARVRVDGTPRWMTSLVRSNAADRRLSYVVTGQGKVTIYDAPWPRPGETALRPTQVAQWDGDFVAAHANIDHNDVIRGCMLAWMGPPDERSLEVLSWSVGPDQKPAAEPMGALQWPHASPIESISVRVRTGGKPAVLLRSALGEWHVFDGAGFEGKVFEPFTRTLLPIELAFFADTEAVLVLAEFGGGLTVKRLDGSDLPPKQR